MAADDPWKSLLQPLECTGNVRIRVIDGRFEEGVDIAAKHASFPEQLFGSSVRERYPPSGICENHRIAGELDSGLES
jgi:hypothetical protein